MDSHRKPSLSALFLTIFIDLLGFGLVLPLLPNYARTFHATGLGIGVLGAAYSLMQFVFVPLWGRLSDRVGRRPMLLWSIAGTFVSMLVLAVAQSYWMLLAARLLGGIATANVPVASAYIADSTSTENRAKGMGIFGAAFGLGFIIGPFLGGILSSRAPWLPAAVAAGLSMVNFFWVLRSLPESLPLSLRSKTVSVRLGLDLSMFRETIRDPELRLALLLFFIPVAAFANLEWIYALFLKDEFGFRESQTGYVFALIGVVAAFMQGFAVRRFARSFADAQLVVAGLAVQLLAFVLIANAHTVPMLLISSALTAVGTGLYSPTLLSLASKLSPPDRQGGTMGLGQSMSSLGRIVGPFNGRIYLRLAAFSAPNAILVGRDWVCHCDWVCVDATSRRTPNFGDVDDNMTARTPVNPPENEHEERFRLERRLARDFAKAVTDFSLIEPHDRIMVALSGGKDSHAMLYFLSRFLRASPTPFELIAVHLDQKQPGHDTSTLVDYLQREGYPFEVVSEDTYSIVQAKTAPGDTQCVLCSRLRRAILYANAKRLRCNKIALGHHRDDALATLLLNLIYAGQLKSIPENCEVTTAKIS